MKVLAPEDFFELQSVKGSPSQVVLTPITHGLIRSEVQDIMDDFVLEAQSCPWQCEEERRRRRGGRVRMEKNSTLELFRLQNDLDRIIEYDQQSSLQSDFDSYTPQEYYRLDEDPVGCNSNTLFTSWSKKTDSKQHTTKDIQLENQTTIDASMVDFTQNIDIFSRNPKLEILTKIKEIEALSSETDLQEKLNLVKQYLESYLLEYEVFCFQEAWKQIQTASSFALLRRGIEEMFGRKIGAIPFENRRVKLLKYLQKKRKRIWKKKVSYDCRKKVADGRLRIKGKFVTREQACEQLGLDSLEHYSPEDIKDMLQKKIDDALRHALC